jgi:predicted dehydrogenase
MSKIVRVGIIGCGQVSQVVHIPTLNFLSDYFCITYLCDVSPGSLAVCASKIPNRVPQTTHDAVALCVAPDVDLVMVVNSDAYHAKHAILALQNDKDVFIEKPMALCERDADAIIEAESKSKGSVMVGYMRRYAAAFVDAVREIGGLERITYARVRGKTRCPMSTWACNAKPMST